MKTTNSKKLVSKKVLIPAILGIGILLSAIFVASPLGNSWAQQQQQQRQPIGMNNTNIREYDTIPKINGSVSVEDNIRKLLILSSTLTEPLILGIVSYSRTLVLFIPVG